MTDWTPAPVFARTPASQAALFEKPVLNTGYYTNLPFYDPNGPDALDLAFKFSFWGTAKDRIGLSYDLSKVTADPTYDVFQDPQIKGRETDLGFLADSQSKEETRRRIEWADRRRVEMETLTKSGWGAAPAMLIASIADPSNVAAGVLGAGAGVMRGMAATAAVVGVEQAAQAAMDPAYTTEQAALTAITAGAIHGVTAAMAGGIAASSRWVGRNDFSEALNKAFAPVREDIPRGAFGDAVDSATGMVKGASDRLKEWWGGKEPVEPKPATVRSTVGAAAATDLPGREALLIDEGLQRTGVGIERLGYNPILRLLNQDNLAAREVVSRLADLGGMVQNKNLRGVATATSVPVNYRAEWLGRLADAITFTDKAFAEARGLAASTHPRLQLLGTAIKDKLGMGKGQMTLPEFRARVGMALRNGDEDIAGDPHVTQAAQLWREKVIEPLKQAGIETGFFEYPIREEIRRLERRLAEAGDNAEWQDKLTAQIKDAKERLKKVVENGPDLLKDRSYFPVVVNTERASADREGFESVIADYLRSQGHKEPNTEAKRIAEEYLTRQPYLRVDPDDTVIAGAAIERKFDIPSDYRASNGLRFSDYLESDVEAVMRHHVRAMGMGVEMMREFGELSLRKIIADITAEAEEQAAKAGAAGRAKIAKDTALALSDVRGMRDLVLGTYGVPEDPYRPISRVMRAAMAWNYIAMLGGAGLSSIPDAGRIMMKEGLERGYRAPLQALMQDSQGWKLAVKEANLAGQALELVLNSRALAFIDIGSSFGSQSKWERALYGSTGLFSTFGNLLAPWNNVMKSWAGAVVSSRIAEDATRLAGGKLGANAATNLAKSGIDAPMAERIAAEFAKHGERRGALWIANSEDWSDDVARAAYRRAIQADVDRVIVTPGVGERPLFASTEIGKLIFQFKAFAFSSVHRTLIAGLQERQSHTIAGAALMAGMGMMVVQLRHLAAGREPERDLGNLIYQGIDRSGVTGILSDVNSTFLRLSGVNSPMAGIYTSHTNLPERAMDLAGPTGGQIRRVLDGQLDTLVPGHNIPWFMWGFRQVAGQD